MRIRLLCILLCAAPLGLEAQQRFGTRLDWGTIEVFITPTPLQGLQFTTGTTRRARVHQRRGLYTGFEPESVFAWLAAADRVVHPGAPPTAPTVVLVTPVLRSMNGDSIRLLRRPKGRKWDSRVALLFDEAGAGGDHFDVLARPREVDALLQGLQREAALSGFDAESVSVRLAVREKADSMGLEVDEPPAVVRAGTVPYPDRSRRGRAIFEFVVQTDGSPDPASIRTIYADDIRFVEWGRTAILDTGFKPGRWHGRPVDVLVRQAVNFDP